MTKQIKLITLSMLIFASLNILKAQTITEEFTNIFFNLYEESPEEAFDFLMKDLKRLDKQSIQNARNQFLVNLGANGVYYGYEKIMERNTGLSFKLVSFLMKFEMNAVRLTIVFYKPKDKWLLVRYDFDTSLIKELIESKSLSTELIRE